MPLNRQQKNRAREWIREAANRQRLTDMYATAAPAAGAAGGAPAPAAPAPAPVPAPAGAAGFNHLVTELQTRINGSVPAAGVAPAGGAAAVPAAPAADADADVRPFLQEQVRKEFLTYAQRLVMQMRRAVAESGVEMTQVRFDAVSRDMHARLERVYTDMGMPHGAGQPFADQYEQDKTVLDRYLHGLDLTRNIYRERMRLTARQTDRDDAQTAALQAGAAPQGLRHAKYVHGNLNFPAEKFKKRQAAAEELKDTVRSLQMPLILQILLGLVYSVGTLAAVLVGKKVDDYLHGKGYIIADDDNDIKITSVMPGYEVSANRDLLKLAVQKGWTTYKPNAEMSPRTLHAEAIRTSSSDIENLLKAAKGMPITLDVSDLQLPDELRGRVDGHNRGVGAARVQQERAVAEINRLSPPPPPPPPPPPVPPPPVP